MIFSVIMLCLNKGDIIYEKNVMLEKSKLDVKVFRFYQKHYLILCKL